MPKVTRRSQRCRCRTDAQAPRPVDNAAHFQQAARSWDLVAETIWITWQNKPRAEISPWQASTPKVRDQATRNGLQIGRRRHHHRTSHHRLQPDAP